MKLVPSLLLVAFVFVAVLNLTGGGPAPMELLRTAGPLGAVAFAVGYAVDVAIFVFLTRKAMGGPKAAPKN